ncbi:UNVERIFIED_CONTAM: hypothetical protein FKN15_001635 [Acipenser sinensis]
MWWLHWGKWSSATPEKVLRGKRHTHIVRECGSRAMDLAVSGCKQLSEPGLSWWLTALPEILQT